MVDQDVPAPASGGAGAGLGPEWERGRRARSFRMTAGSWKPLASGGHATRPLRALGTLVVDSSARGGPVLVVLVGAVLPVLAKSFYPPALSEP
jgi:hypothetical protein